MNIPALGGLKQEDCPHSEFRASQGYRIRSYLKIPKNTLSQKKRKKTSTSALEAPELHFLSLQWHLTKIELSSLAVLATLQHPTATCPVAFRPGEEI